MDISSDKPCDSTIENIDFAKRVTPKVRNLIYFNSSRKQRHKNQLY